MQTSVPSCVMSATGVCVKTVPLCANVIASAAFAFSPLDLCLLQNALIYVVFLRYIFFQTLILSPLYSKIVA